VRKILAIAVLGILSLAALVMPVGSSPVARADSVPNPTVSGPIAANVPPGDPSHDYTFFATNLDLASKGYVEQEYFIDGFANRYDTPTLQTGTIIDGNHHYRTRIVVRRPIDPRRFNGTVLLEWQNVTAGYDLDAMWVPMAEHIMDAGYAWVGVSTQLVGVHGPGTGLRAWSPIRYGTLDVTAFGTVTDDSLCYDIYSQAAKAIRSPVGVDPMGGLKVKRVIAEGASQSAMKLTTYYNSIQPLAGVIDAYDFSVGGGPFRGDLGIKKFRYITETDLWVPLIGQALLRAPDSNEFRGWEVAGAAHYDYYSQLGTAPLVARDGIPATPTNCAYPPFSQIPFYQVGNAVLDNLVRWVKYGIPPPSAPPIQLLSPIPPFPVDPIVRDSYGNALGGIRLSQEAVPTATNTGLNGGPVFCVLFGTHIPFSETTLAALYPSHLKYVAQVTKVNTKNLLAGYILAPDAWQNIVDAWEAEVP
jgi:hypothetical protein